jgi:hypothetical protein
MTAGHDTIRRRLVAGAARLVALAAAPRARATDVQLPAPASLADALAAALARSQPLVVLASLHGCPFCRIVRESYLMPEVAAGLPVVQIDFRDRRVVRDFDGVPRTHDALIRSWKVGVAPTVLFFGPDAREVAERLSGGESDFYAAYLEERIRKARAAARV